MEKHGLAAMLDSKMIDSVPESQLIKIEGDLLEIDALLVVLQDQPSAFDDAMGRLKQYYRNNPSEGNSPRAIQMLGLDLMHLLAENQRSRFHMELERLPREMVASSEYLSTPIKLGQYLMEGAYNKVFLSEKHMPSPYYLPFYRTMLDTVRTEIAASIEKAYPKLSAQTAAKMLFFTDVDEVLEFGKKKNWSLDVQTKTFVFRAQDVDATSLDAGRLLDTALLKQNIFYAKQLETIV